MTEAERIAAGLTEAQRLLMASARPYPGVGLIHQYPVPKHSNTLGTVAALWRRGLVETSDEFSGPDAWERCCIGFVTFTPLGLAVRQLLEARELARSQDGSAAS